LHSPPAPPVTTTHTVVVGGMPGWQITLIAASAAVLATTLALILDRARTARRQHGRCRPPSFGGRYAQPGSVRSEVLSRRAGQ